MSEMNGGQLRHALKQVHMKENMQEEIIMNVRTQMADGTYRRNSFKRMAMSAAAFMLVFGAVSIPSYAAISNLVRARMEAIPRAEVEATEDMIQSQQIHADQFSREYTREERKRMDALRQEYENGMFPENTLTLVENESQVPDGDTLAYTKDTGCFYLPDRELTDEELLQILDFNAARDYALDQSPEVQKAREEAKAEAEERAAQAGGSGILKMKPGEADGEVLQVTAPDGMVFSVMTTDEQGNLYVVAEDRDIEAVMRDDEVVCPTEHCEVWRVSPSGEVAAKLDISEYVKQEVFSPRMIAVAGNGDIYLSTQNDGTAVLAFDAEGNFLNKISYDYKVYTLRTAMGRGRDGKVYAVLWDSIANDGTSVIVELDADLSGEENHMVVLDAGHGGEDGGTVEQAATEKEINLAVVLKLKELLEEQGIRVVLTRDKDIFMKLEERVQIANGEKADLFISIHCNYYEKDSSIYGLECYYCKSGEEGKHYAERIMETIEESKNIVSRNVKPADYYILKNTTVPAVLVEIGYLSNYNERNQLMSEEYQEKLAGELVKGIVKGMEERTG